MFVVTAYVYGSVSVLEAPTRDRLARRLYLTCPWWSRDSCRSVADRLTRRQVVTAPDFETLLLPGEFEVLEVRPDEDPTWVPDRAVV